MFAACGATFASNFSVSGPGGTIPDNPLPGQTTAPSWDISFAATGGTPFTSSVTCVNPVASLTAVKLRGLSHTWRGDLHMFLRDPNGVAYNLVVRPGFSPPSDLFGFANDYIPGDFTFVDTGGANQGFGGISLAPGTYNLYYNSGAGQWTNGMSNTPLANIAGPAGVWTLEIRDWGRQDTGSLTGWTLEGTDGPAVGFHAFCAGDGSLTDHTTPCPCGNNGAAGNGCGHSFDPNGANMSATGSAANDDVVLHTQFEPASSFTLMMQHASTGDTVFHDGVLCAGNPLIRLRGRSAVGGEAFFPNSNFAQDSTTTLSVRGSVTVGSGATRYYAGWYRNASTTFCPPATANVTNGWVVVW